MRAAVLAVAALLAAPAAAPAAATVTTGPARDVTRGSAVLVATVDPDGTAVSVRFDLGTSTSYGLQSEAREVAGEDPVEVAIPVSGLTAGTTYHARAVAGQARGADVTFRTADPVRAPGVRVLPAVEVTGDGATLQARVDPNGAATRWRFEWGESPRLGRSTGEVTIPEGDGARTVSARLAGLRPGRLHHARLVAVNAQGTSRSGTTAFRSDRRLTGLSLTAEPPVAVWGTTLRLTGRLSGGAPGGVALALERQEWPFTGVFGAVPGKGFRTGSSGAFSLTLPVFRSVRLRVRGSGASSAVLPVLVRPQVGRRVARDGDRVRFTGVVRPALPGARVSLQRRSASGRWSPVVRGEVAVDGARSSYALTAPATRRAAVWRVVVVPPADGAYVRGTSRELRVRGT